MPIKIPGFQRRKSSGNVLDEPPAGEGSFKVFARPQSGHKSLDTNMTTKKSASGRRNSYEREDEDLFTVLRPDAANRGTEHSLSTAPYSSGASSTRLSSSSTNPSSVDTRSDKNGHSAVHLPHTEYPPVPLHQNKTGAFLRNAGRTFSFGVKAKPFDAPDPVAPPPPAPKNRFSISQPRERSTTESSVTTTTPPRLLASDLSLDGSGLGSFENMFDGIGARSRDHSPSRILPAETTMTPNVHQTSAGIVHPPRLAQPQSASIGRIQHVESSPYSWTSENSRDALMHTPNSVDTVVHNSPQLTSGKPFAQTTNQPASVNMVESGADDNMFSETPSRPRAYSRSNRQNAAPPTSFPTPRRQNTMTGTSIQNSPIPERSSAEFDPSLLASAALATQYQETKSIPPPPPSNKKVMTPAQFERYRQQQEERHRMNKVFKNRQADSDESDDNYDDAEEDDQAERDRHAAKQRRKQEAHLAVYRQTMMKVTGEVPATNSHPNITTVSNHPAASQSTTDLANQFSSINFDKSPARSIEDEEDDDVPLGILAAHGFPNKNRPPNRLTSSSSNPNLRGFAPQQQQPVPGSVTGESMKRGSLPVFARHLPEDPYYGASLVNQSNRESMALHTNHNFVPSGAATAHPHHPAGLVGVIAGEERARAMRRGSPNFDLPPAMNGHPGMPRSQTTGSMPNLMVPGMQGMAPMPGMPMMMPGMPMPLSPGDHAQIQMSQQMTQMMQMQMQWMQQMQQMMGNQGANSSAPQIPQIPQMGHMPMHTQAAASVQRPQSVPLQGHGAPDQRTMSLLSPPGTGGWNARPLSTYAPSMAPSERSNVGLASRYRPVSTAQEPEPSWNKRTSTMTSFTSRPWSHIGGSKQTTPTIRKVPATIDDEDDEQGWAEMKAKKDQKKKVWKLRKGQNVLQELYNPTT